jgi:hypothetical protein
MTGFRITRIGLRCFSALLIIHAHAERLAFIKLNLVWPIGAIPLLQGGADTDYGAKAQEILGQVKGRSVLVGCCCYVLFSFNYDKGSRTST